MSKKQDSTSLDILHFNQLLIKTDLMLTHQAELNNELRNEIFILKKQLDATSELHKNVTNNFRIERKSDIFKFGMALNSMYTTAAEYRICKLNDSLDRFESCIYRMKILDDEKLIMQTQISNSILMVDTNANSCWLRLCNRIFDEQSSNKYNYEHGECGDYKNSQKRFLYTMELLHKSLDTLFEFSNKQAYNYTRYKLKIN